MYCTMYCNTYFSMHLFICNSRSRDINKSLTSNMEENQVWISCIDP